MKKYITNTIDAMTNEIGLSFMGVENEIASHFIDDENSHLYPIIVECFGITFEDKRYEITRENQPRFVIEYVLNGKGKVEINDKSFDVNKGDVYILEANTKQHYYSNKNEPFRKYWINFRSNIFSNLLEMLNLKGIYHFKEVNIEDLFIKLFSLEKISNFSNDISYQAINILFEMLTRIKASITNNEHAYIPQYLKEAKSIIDNNLENEISINDICSKLYISKPTLIINFKKYYGDTPHQYKTKKKSQLACIMLSSSNLDINTIANNLGFQDSFTFSHWFKKIHSVSPTKFRLLHK